MNPGDVIRQRGCDPTGVIIAFTKARARVYVRLTDGGGVVWWQTVADKRLCARGTESGVNHIVRTRDVIGGRPRIDGTRLSSAFIWRASLDGTEVDYVLRNWPELAREQIDAAIRYERRWYRRLGRRLPVLYLNIETYDQRERDFQIGGWGW